jgi:T4 RnlA family RNA ligase
MFNLKDFDHLRDEPTVQFKDEVVDGVEVTSICYMISNDELWKLPLGMECRGHSFRKDTGEVISMAFHKFWNLFEKEETQPHNITWDEPFEVQEKRDGSMITFALINDKVYAKTKKSFFSSVAILANELISPNVYGFVKHCLSVGLSPIFEFTHPDHKIVVDYGKEATWTLLAIRSMYYGIYFDKDELKWSADNNNIKLIKFYPLLKSYDEIHTSISGMKDAEGYVIHFPNTGFRVKTKSNWYNIRHHINTDLREREVARYTVEETLDDVKSTIVELGYDMSKVIEIENRVINNMTFIKVMIDTIAESIKQYPSRKDAAIELSKQKFFGEAIRLIDGREIDYKKIWYRDYLHQYSLKTVYSDFNHMKELDAVN